MDFHHPGAGLFGTVEAAALGALYRHQRDGFGALTIQDVHRMAGTGSYETVRRVLRRLERVGIVQVHVLAAGRLHRLNRDHLGYHVIEAAMAMPEQLVARIAERLERWPAEVAHASLVGAFAEAWHGFPWTLADAAPWDEGPGAIELLVIHRSAGGADANTSASWDLVDEVQDWTGHRLVVHAFEHDDLRARIAARNPPDVMTRRSHAYVMVAGSEALVSLYARPRRAGALHVAQGGIEQVA